MAAVRAAEVVVPTASPPLSREAANAAIAANMWGSVVVSLLFWGFANEVTTVSEAKKYYPLFGLFANVALVFSGQFVRYVSQLHTSLPVRRAGCECALKTREGTWRKLYEAE